MSQIHVKYAGSPAFEATAAGPVPGLSYVQAWFTKAQLQPIIEWANSHTAEHEVNGIGYDEYQERWFEIPGRHNDLTGTYQLLCAEEIEDNDIAYWQQNSEGLINLNTFMWEVCEPAPPEPPTVGDAIHTLVEIATLLGDAEKWPFPADFLKDIANLIGTVLPHPGDWDTETKGEYGERAREAAADFLA